ncbi:DUF262 domain-containing protein [Streptomyces sp. NPDC058155]|uniref:DUF262 domain-containing protein n=1 Tax=Streptomyces sp. NPDC058155 TaxID=3346359 RepID=UPI0036E5E04D
MTIDPSGLDARPAVTSYKIGDLVRLAWSGRIRVPHFQRDFRWESQDVTRLFDSVAKGYPIGNLLLAVREQESEERFTLGRLRLTSPVSGESLWVVDGQQRVISLANALSADAHPYRPFTVFYDLVAGEFLEGERGTGDRHLVPLPLLFDVPKLVTWFSSVGVPVEELVDEAVRVAVAIGQYEVPAYLVRVDDRQVLTDIFQRTNTHGRRLNRAEIFSALYGRDNRNGEEELTLGGISDNVATRTGFGSIDADTVLAAVLARRHPEPGPDDGWDEYPAGQAEYPDEDWPTAFVEGEEALVRTVDFLIREAGVPHVSLLPYRTLLVLLTRFFAHFPHPGSNSLRLLRRLFWRLSLVGPTHGAGFLTRAIRPGDEEGSLRALLGTLPVARPPLPRLDRFRPNEAATRIVLGAWWSLRPRSLVTGRVLDAQDLDAVLQQDRNAVNATPMIYPSLVTDTSHRQRCANRLLLPSDDDPVSEIPGALAHQPVGLDDATWDAVLASHLLDRDTAALAGRDADAFLEARQERISRQLAHFVGQMAEWDYEDTPALDSLDLDDEFQDTDDADRP